MKNLAPAVFTLSILMGSTTVTFADESVTSAYSTRVSPPTSHIAPSTYKFTNPRQMEPASVVDQRLIRKTIYTDPMHCDTTHLLTPLQIQAAQQACSERLFNVDHSG